MIGRRLFVVALALAAAACAAPGPLPEDHYYRLPVAEPKQRYAAPRVPGIIVVERPRATGVHLERALVYSDDPQQLRLAHYHYHHWADPPPRLLQHELVSYLRAANLAGTVTADGGRVLGDYRITTLVRRFERLKTEQGWQVAVALELRAESANGSRPVLLREYEAITPAEGESIEATVRAFSTGTHAVFDRFLTDFAQALPAPEATLLKP